MILNFKCETEEFLKFKNGMYTSILIAGTKKLYENAYRVDLGDVVAVSNCVSDETLTYRVSHLIKYTGASTHESALGDLRARIGLTDIQGTESIPIYVASDKPGSPIPYLYEGIYALLIERYRNRTAAKGGKNRRKKP